MTSSWNPNLSYGASSSKFGHQDYTGALKEIWDQGAEGRQKKLMQRRKDVLAWMGDEANKDKIAEQNRRGASGGLYSDISGGALTWKHQGGGLGMQPNAEGEMINTAPSSANWIGHADMYAGRAAGHSWGDIQKWMDENPGKLRGDNPQGKGGLYDEVATEVRFENQAADWADSLGSLQEQMGMNFTDLSGSFEEGMGGVSDAIKSQTASEERYRADQQNWQRRQENMQQMMIQEGRRKAREKPVMAVMPGASSYGGGGGGASSFARKKKQTTGLNIA